ncbi:MAG: hypothetical protein JRJ54_12880 [Deltaproteobacteria bacterium]|nr:hypothetical protein [Deltaproteobacteria bacterium]
MRNNGSAWAVRVAIPVAGPGQKGSHGLDPLAGFPPDLDGDVNGHMDSSPI